MATTKLRTADDLWAMGERDGRYELIEGVLREMSPVGKPHARIAVKISTSLEMHNRQHHVGTVYGEAGFILARDPDVVLSPDVAFVRSDRDPSDPNEEGYLSVSPDIAVEILSPGDRPGEVEDKIRRYVEAGIALVWVFDPRRRHVTVVSADGTRRVLSEADELDGGVALPGFRLRVGDAFT